MCSSLKKLINNKPISHLSELAAIEDVWNEIYGTDSSNSIFVSFDYIMMWYKSFVDPEQVRVYPIYEGDKLIGFLPLFLYKKGPIRLISSLTNLHCFHPAALIAAGYEEIFSKNCLDAILSDKNGWDILKYRYYSFQKGLSLQNISQRQYRIKEYSRRNYSILLPDSFEEFFYNHLSVKARRTAKNEKNRLSRKSFYNFDHYTGDNAIVSWPTFLSIEDAGWKGLKGSSLKSLPENFRSYYESLIRLLSKNNKLHMYFLNVEGRPVAGLFGYEDQNMFHGCKSGYLEEFSSLSPSNNLWFFIIEDLISNYPTIQRLNLFPDDFGYKHRFSNEDSFYYEEIVYNNTLGAISVYYLHMLKQRIKNSSTQQVKLGQ